MEVMEDDEFFSQDWATRVKQMLYENSEERIVRNNFKQLFGVLKALLSGNPQAYIPQLIKTMECYSSAGWDCFFLQHGLVFTQ